MASLARNILMTVRLRVMSGGTTSEYAFDRTKISVGRSPANDLAISSGSVALKHGVLEFGEDGVLRFLVDACGQTSMLVRDGEVARELEASGRASLELRESDFLILGGVTRIEVLEARTREAAGYAEYRLDAHLSYDLPVAVSGRYLRALDHLSAASNRVRTLLVEACGLVESLIGARVNRAVVSLFTEHDEFHDDTWALEFGQAEADSELFDMARDPLAHFGPAAKKDALELFVQGRYLIAQSERGIPSSAFLVGIVQNERCIGGACCRARRGVRGRSGARVPGARAGDVGDVSDVCAGRRAARAEPRGGESLFPRTRASPLPL